LKTETYKGYIIEQHLTTGTHRRIYHPDWEVDDPATDCAIYAHKSLPFHDLAKLIDEDIARQAKG
jgi:hypothetical protein